MCIILHQETRSVKNNRGERLISALEDIYNHCFADGDYVMTLQFGIDIDDELWADAKITPQGEPGNSLSAYCGEIDTLEDIIIDLAEGLVNSDKKIE